MSGSGSRAWPAKSGRPSGRATAASTAGRIRSTASAMAGSSMASPSMRRRAPSTASWRAMSMASGVVRSHRPSMAAWTGAGWKLKNVAWTTSGPTAPIAALRDPK